MGLFFSKPTNRRRRHLIRRKDSAWIDETEMAVASSGRKKNSENSPREKVHRLHAEIGAIESFLARHHRAEVERARMRKENILPPPDRSPHREARTAMTLAAQRKHLAERNRTSFCFLVLFSTACALLWWLVGGAI